MAASKPEAPSDPVYDRETLNRRLEDGYRRIEEAQAQGRDVKHWEEFWIQLLREYEALCDGLREADQ